MKEKDEQLAAEKSQNAAKISELEARLLEQHSAIARLETSSAQARVNELEAEHKQKEQKAAAHLTEERAENAKCIRDLKRRLEASEKAHGATMVRLLPTGERSQQAQVPGSSVTKELTKS